MEPGAPGALVGDPVRIRQVLINLVSNAIKFTEHGEVVVRVRSAGLDNGRCRLHVEVADTGIGIGPDALATLFQPFIQADASMTRRFGGTGLGLAICRRLVELMGGEIGAKSDPGRGSTFWFDVMLDMPEQDGTAVHALNGSSGFAGRRVLVAEDNVTCRSIAIRQLAHWGVHHGAVDSAESAASELERAAAAGKPYDLVILDHSLPDASGPWLATMRSARGHTRPPAVALLTSRKLSTDAREGLAPGIDLCESKPLSPSRLHSLLSKAFSGSDRDATPKASGCAATGNRGNCTAAPFHNARILVAEDNVVNQKVAVLQLRKLGCEADVAGNGREALAAITTRHYDFVFMDCQMPELDGFEATRIIRKAQAAGDPAYPAHLPIIAMTAHAMAGVREECVEAGMDDYVSKPVRIERVKEMLDRYISPKQTAQAAQIT